MHRGREMGRAGGGVRGGRGVGGGLLNRLFLWWRPAATAIYDRPLNIGHPLVENTCKTNCAVMRRYAVVSKETYMQMDIVRTIKPFSRLQVAMHKAAVRKVKTWPAADVPSIGESLRVIRVLPLL